MKKNLARLLATVFPLLSGCVDDVPLADRSDGGPRDVPPADVPVSPYSDVPPMDAPATGVCAACGGLSGINCLYAPGCGAVVRVCAINTCGDAAFIPFCGCDGQTFGTGCLTPDRTYLHAGRCEPDGGSTDPSGVPYCLATVDHNTAQNPDLRFQRAAFRLPPGVSVPAGDAGPDLDVRAVWVGVQRLGATTALGCAEDAVTDTCVARSVIRFRDGDAGTATELLVTTRFEELPLIPVGLPVIVRASASRWDGVAGLGYRASLTVHRAIDGALLMALSTGDTLPATFDGLAGVTISESSRLCVSRPEPLCRRVLSTFGLSAVYNGNASLFSVGQTSEMFTAQGGYQLTNRVVYRRTPSGGGECADVTRSVYSIEITRTRDP